MTKIKRVMAYAEVMPSGQKVTAAIVEYDSEICGEGLDNAYSVEGRSVRDIYVNTVPEKTDVPKSQGKYVIVCLDPTDEKAATVNSGPSKTDRRGPGGPPPGGPKKVGKDGPGPGEHSPKMVHKKPEVVLTQKKIIYTSTGEMVPESEAMKSEIAIQPIVDNFHQFEYNGIPYNLYIPKGYDEKKEYPLVMFLHDAEPCGTDPLLTLVQGIGAIRFASPRDQKLHKSFVLAPEIPPELRPLEEVCERDITTVMKPILDHVMEKYSIDQSRVYTTGQSGGCMTSCELNHRYPELFAASLLVAGQWDADRMRNTKGNHYWICVSEHDVQAFPGMTKLTEALHEEGASVYQYYCNAKGGSEYLNDLARKAIAQNTDIIFTVFEGDSVVAEGYPLNSISNHLSTWQVAYDIDAIRDWLFTQKRKQEDDRI